MLSAAAGAALGTGTGPGLRREPCWGPRTAVLTAAQPVQEPLREVASGAPRPAGAAVGPPELDPSCPGGDAHTSGCPAHTSGCPAHRSSTSLPVRGHPLLAMGHRAGAFGSRFSAMGAVGSSPGVLGQRWLGAHQLLRNERFGVSRCVLEQELKAALAAVSHPRGPRLPRRAALPMHGAVWEIAFHVGYGFCKGFFLSSRRWAARPGGRWAAEAAGAAVLARPGCASLLGLDPPRGVRPDRVLRSVPSPGTFLPGTRCRPSCSGQHWGLGRRAGQLL